MKWNDISQCLRLGVHVLPPTIHFRRVVVCLLTILASTPCKFSFFLCWQIFLKWIAMKKWFIAVLIEQSICLVSLPSSDTDCQAVNKMTSITRSVTQFSRFKDVVYWYGSCTSSRVGQKILQQLIIYNNNNNTSLFYEDNILSIHK